MRQFHQGRVLATSKEGAAIEISKKYPGCEIWSINMIGVQPFEDKVWFEYTCEKSLKLGKIKPQVVQEECAA